MYYEYGLSIPWFDNAAYEAEDPLPKLEVYKGVTDIAIFKGNPNTPAYRQCRIVFAIASC